MYVELISKDEFLSHHGVKGQSWGDRNGPPYPLSRLSDSIEDGIRKKRKLKLQKENERIKKRTSELKKRNRKNKEIKKLVDKNKELKEEYRKNKLDDKRSKTNYLKKNDIRQMSNEEIKNYINRLQLEKQAWNLNNETAIEGARVVEDILKKTGQKSAESLLTFAIVYTGKQVIQKLLKNIV